MHYPCSCDIYYSTTYHFSVYEVTYETLGHTHPEMFFSENGEYIPAKKDMELESNPWSKLSSIHPENHWRLMKDFVLKIIEKTEHDQMG